MNAVIAAAADLQAVCEGEGWRFCFIGGLAVLRWGEPRETVDVDLTLITGFRDEASFVSVLLRPGSTRPPRLPAGESVGDAGYWRWTTPPFITKLTRAIRRTSIDRA